MGIIFAALKISAQHADLQHVGKCFDDDKADQEGNQIEQLMYYPIFAHDSSIPALCYEPVKAALNLCEMRYH